MEVRIATFNIFWFPSSLFIGNRRSSDDREKIREVIRRLDADVLIFQEILALEALEELLSDVVPSRSYRMRDDAGKWAASGIEKDDMKVPLAFDSSKLELLEAGSVRRPGDPAAAWGRREPVAARLQPVGGGPIFTVIGVHLKSGYLTEGPDPVTQDDHIRVEEMTELSEWIATLAPIAPGAAARPAGEPTVLVGDFNAVRRNAAMKPFLPGGALSSWSWPEPRFASAMSPSPVEMNFQDHERWTTHLDKKVIDHVMVSPELTLAEAPWVYAFDQDESWLQTVGVSRDWLEQGNYMLTPSQEPPREVENLHRISDHRPVRATLVLT